MKTLLVAAALCLFAALAFSQGNTALLNGSVVDPTGAAVPAAEVAVGNAATGQTIKTNTNERGEWAVPSMPAGTYRVTVTKPGFKVANVTGVVMSAGVPATVPVKLEVGQATETVTVSTGAEIVQTQSAEVSSTITGRQINELPFATRNAVELMVTQPGTSTPTNPRSSSINGLPKGAINITIDGMNTQDNLLKSNDGFFSYIMPSIDSLEEVTLTTSAGGVDSTGQGAAQIKFVTKSGTNQFHGGVFTQVRNTFFDANYYFNNQKGLPRDIMHLRQYGGHIGGPVLKDKLFFFTNYEIYRQPGTQSYARTVLTDDARNGNYTYKDSAGALHTVNLYNIAGSGNGKQAAGVRAFPTTPDPITSATYSQIAKLTSGGNLQNNVASNDYNTMRYNYQPDGTDSRDFLTARVDYNLTQKHHLAAVYNYDKYDSVPDFLNNIVPVYAGTGTILGSNINTGQGSNRFAGTLTLRSAISARFTNELRGGLSGGTVLFAGAIGSDAIFAQWRNYNLNMANGAITTRSTSSRRNSPTKDFADTVSWVKGAHQLSFGGNFTQINLWQQAINTNILTGLSVNGVQTGDPLITGANAPFQQGANFPGATSGQVSTAATLYASLVGRVSSITSGLSLDENTHKYAHVGSIDRNQMREYGLFGQDVWRIASNLTLTLGMRWEKQGTWENLNHTYTKVGLDSAWGLSGINNLFKPGTLTGVVPAFTPVTDTNAYKLPAVWAPSAGLAWQLPSREGVLGWLLGKHQGASVIRLGYSIATIREGSNLYQNIYGSNKGLNFDASLNPTTFPADFGPAGSVLFRDATLPSRSGLPTSPSYPLTANFTDSLNEFTPHLKMGYVQSWNIGWQRELGRNTVVEARFTGNHGLKEWRQYNLNEVNIFENGFLTEFLNAQNNLRIARNGNIYGTNSNNFGNAGLPGQVAIPFLQAALGTACCTDGTTASNLMLGQTGTLASAISTNATRNANFTSKGYAANYFVVNPSVANGGTYLVTNDGRSFYDALQIEVRRRMAQGMQLQGSYVYSKSLAAGATSSAIDSSQPTTLRNLNLDKGPSPFDIRQAIKLNYIYELPFGPGRALLSGVHNVIARKALEGWGMAGVVRLQSGTPFYWSSFANVNQNAAGVVYHNITQKQLQESVSIVKSSVAGVTHGVLPAATTDHQHAGGFQLQ